MSHRRVTLALGGGGARGVAHLGVIEEVLRSGWDVGRVIGISIGSLAGAMFAFDPDIDVVQRRALDFLLSPEFSRKQRELIQARPLDAAAPGGFFAWYHSVVEYLQAHQKLTRAITRRSLLSGALLEEVCDHLLPDADIADAAIPLGVVAVDLQTGEPVVLERGPLRTAVQASASLPGIFPPVRFDGRLLCDLGVVASLPARIARRMEPCPIIAVDVASRLKPVECTTALDVLMRMIEIGEWMFRDELRKAADLLIEPDVGDIHWADFSQSAALIQIGCDAARDALRDFRPGSRWYQRLWTLGIGAARSRRDA
jgi:NTE family protein